MRDRLIEVLREPIPVIRGLKIFGESRMSAVDAERYADHLIANGVIMPPCNVGDTVYYIHHGGSRVHEGEVTSYVYVSDSKSFGIHHDGGYGVYGRYVFLSREEAERALKGEHRG